MSEQDLRALDWAEEMWAAVIHETRDSGIAVAARYVAQSVSRQMAEAVAAECERCAALLDHVAAETNRLINHIPDLHESLECEALALEHDLSVKVATLQSAAGRIRAGKEG